MLKHKHKKMIRGCYCIRFSHDNLQQVSGLHHHYCTFGNMYVCEVRYIPQYITVIPQKKVFWNVGEFNQFYGIQHPNLHTWSGKCVPPGPQYNVNYLTLFFYVKLVFQKQFPGTFTEKPFTVCISLLKTILTIKLDT